MLSELLVGHSLTCRDAPSSRLAPGQIGRNERHRLYVHDHLVGAKNRCIRSRSCSARSPATLKLSPAVWPRRPANQVSPRPLLTSRSSRASSERTGSTIGRTKFVSILRTDPFMTRLRLRTDPFTPPPLCS